MNANEHGLMALKNMTGVKKFMLSLKKLCFIHPSKVLKWFHKIKLKTQDQKKAL